MQRVLIVSENISMQMGGESSLPFYYAKLFAKRGVEVSLACHERVAEELRAALPELASRMHFVRDTQVQKLMFKYGSALSYRLRDSVINQAIHFSTQARIRDVARDLAQRGLIDVVFEPAPITPRGLSFMHDIGVPVVIGPLCGGMNFPPAFRDLDSFITRQSISLARLGSELAHRLVPGKLEADVLLVANELTGRSLPIGHKARVVRLVESGVDLELWQPPRGTNGASKKARVEARKRDEPVRFVFSGRFVDWKGIQYLVPAFAKALAEEPRCRLALIGSGELEAEVRSMIDALGIAHAVELHGWLDRPQAAALLRASDVFVMPSLRECGGTAILEAMALGKPVITTNWGGPADYVDARSGVLVDPSSKQDFIDGLAAAMVRLTRSAELRQTLGARARERVREDYLDWESKADRMLAILRETIEARRCAERPARVSLPTPAHA